MGIHHKRFNLKSHEYLATSIGGIPINKVHKVKGFIHRPGVHCDSSALRDVFECHGFRFSEAMIFGLGSGLGFIYWKSKQMPYPFAGGRIGDLDENLCSNLGVTMKVHKTTSRKRAYQALKELISQDVPVLIHVDMPYLKYLGLPEEAHFGAHSVVVAGIDEERGITFIADTAFRDLQTATLKELEEARASKAKPFPAENKWFTFEFPPKLTPIDQATKNAIRKTVENMLYPPVRNFGVKGIRRFATEIIKWPKEYPPEKFPSLYEVAYGFIEEFGTGGGCFRYLYSKFLKEAGEVLEDERLADSSKKYHEVGEKWTHVARLIRDIPRMAKKNSEEAWRILLEIANNEKGILKSLEGVVER